MNTQQKMLADAAVAPTALADAVGSAYAAIVSPEHRRAHGLYVTPPAVACFMGGLAVTQHERLRLLDPAAGAGVLLCGAVEALAGRPCPPTHIAITAYEVDPLLAQELHTVLVKLSTWAGQRGIAVTTEVRAEDFVLANADALDSLTDLFRSTQDQLYDVVIANPPYFKLNKADPRAQAAASVVHGQPNIYALFMAIGASLLRPGGDFIFITPRSFASGPYFRTFRERFFQIMRPDLVHVFGSRRDAFARDDVLQENVVLHATRKDDWSGGSIKLSSSAGVADLDQAVLREVPLSEVYSPSSHDRVLRMPGTLSDSELMQRVDAWPGSFASYGWKISTGPVVPFRAREFQSSKGGADHVPLIWMNHVTPMQVTWPIEKRKPEHLLDVLASQRILLANVNYVLMRRFSAKEEKRRLVAAPYIGTRFHASRVGLENHLNYIHRPGGSLTEDEAYGLAALLNSTVLDTWFRAVNGNTQVSATEIRSMPLPPHEAIVEIGSRARGTRDLVEIDHIVEGTVGQD